MDLDNSKGSEDEMDDDQDEQTENSNHAEEDLKRSNGNLAAGQTSIEPLKKIKKIKK